MIDIQTYINETAQRKISAIHLNCTNLLLLIIIRSNNTYRELPKFIRWQILTYMKIVTDPMYVQSK